MCVFFCVCVSVALRLACHNKLPHHNGTVWTKYWKIKHLASIETFHWNELQILALQIEKKTGFSIENDTLFYSLEKITFLLFWTTNHSSDVYRDAQIGVDIIRFESNLLKYCAHGDLFSIPYSIEYDEYSRYLLRLNANASKFHSFENANWKLQRGRGVHVTDEHPIKYDKYLYKSKCNDIFIDVFFITTTLIHLNVNN